MKKRSRNPATAVMIAYWSDSKQVEQSTITEGDTFCYVLISHVLEKRLTEGLVCEILDYIPNWDWDSPPFDVDERMDQWAYQLADIGYDVILPADEDE